MASDIIQKWAFAEQKTVAATISIHTHRHTLPTLPKTLRISATIKSKFNFKNIFSDIVYNVENKTDFAKNKGAGAGPRPPGSAPDNMPSSNKKTQTFVRRVIVCGRVNCLHM